MIELKHLRKEYPNAIPLKDVSVTIHKGDVIAIIGPSGTGKSTLIRCINQLDTPTSGEVIFQGRTITDPAQYDTDIRRKIGMVFQSYNLFGHMTVLENVMYVPVHKQKIPKEEAYEKALHYLRLVGMGEKCFNYPDQLSGGQMQRVAIARTLATEPEVILLDEPTSALDPTMVGEVESVIRMLAENGTTMMIVTHSMNLARNVANRVFYMDEGGIYEDGTPEQIFEHPQKERTRAFIQNIKTLTIEITSHEHDFISSVSRIDNFAMTNRISKTYTTHIQSLFEEICMQTLLPYLQTDPHIEVTLEYTETTGRAHMRIRYNGDQFDLRDHDDPLVQALIGKYSADLSYKTLDDGEFTNAVHLDVV